MSCSETHTLYRCPCGDGHGCLDCDEPHSRVLGCEDACGTTPVACRDCGARGYERAVVAEQLGYGAGDVHALALLLEDDGLALLEAGVCGACSARRAA